MDESSWLLFAPQTPSSPSSLRVLIWRRMREVGAIGLQSGLWALPQNADTTKIMRDLLEQTTAGGGHGLIFVARTLDGTDEDELKDRFRAARDEEYSEVLDGCRDFLAEMEKETAAENFTFPEWEENDEDLKKLTGWLRKVRVRDFFGGRQAETAVSMLRQCHDAFAGFTRKVYSREGLDPVEPEDEERGEKHE